MNKIIKIIAESIGLRERETTMNVIKKHIEVLSKLKTQTKYL